NFPVLDGLTVRTDSEKVKKHRKLVIELIMARAPGAPQIREMAKRLGVEDVRHRPQQDELCILCGLCARVCDEAIGAQALTFIGRGGLKDVGTPYAEASENCIGCGACEAVCPTGAITMTESNGRRRIWHRDFEMVACTKCGRSYITVEQMHHLVSRTDLDESYFELCDECSRRAVAVKMLENVV
ncbi:MAG: 4Fe-4S dicluster domain-containing protein, partial [Deltaproteobacteria bacterium]|nr:4Fe-4S dicluster domain-containing protein [Deltaproteobacteria bacterium]